MTPQDELLRVLGDAWRASILRELADAKADRAPPPIDLAELREIAADAVQLRSDRELIKQASGGDRRALDLLVERLAPAIQRRVRRRIRQHHLGRQGSAVEKDLVQDCMVRLFAERARMLRQWRPDKGATLDAWCGYVADSVVLAYLRSGRRSGWREIPDEDEAHEPRSNDVELETQTLDRAFLTRLMQRLKKVLSPATLSLFWALYVEERDPEDVARELGKSRDAIYTAKARLVQQIQREARSLAGDGQHE